MFAFNNLDVIDNSVFYFYFRKESIKRSSIVFNYFTVNTQTRECGKYNLEYYFAIDQQFLVGTYFSEANLKQSALKPRETVQTVCI